MEEEKLLFFIDNIKKILILMFSCMLLTCNAHAVPIEINTDPDMKSLHQKMLKDLMRENKEKYKKEVVPYLNEGHQKQLAESRSRFYSENKGRILVFISSSMNKNNIKELLDLSSKFNARIVMRGFIEGSFKKTASYLGSFYDKDLGASEKTPGILVDPVSFREFNIESVPSFVLLPEDGIMGDKSEYLKLSGNITLSKASAILTEASNDILDKSKSLSKNNTNSTGTFKKDLGVFGERFQIREMDLVHMMKSKLSNLEEGGRLDVFNKKLQDKVKAKIHRPEGLKHIRKVTKYKKFLVDLSITTDKDISDIKGGIIVKAGAKVNPLDHIEFSKNLYFIDGDDKKQIQWMVSNKQDSHKRIIILVGGSPYELQKILGERVYFDQKGAFCDKFWITGTPSIVSPAGSKVQVEEIAL